MKLFQETDLDLNSFLSLVQNSDIRNKLMDKIALLFTSSVKAADDFIHVRNAITHKWLFSYWQEWFHFI